LEIGKNRVGEYGEQNGCGRKVIAEVHKAIVTGSSIAIVVEIIVTNC
jgi:hypothetical protein